MRNATLKNKLVIVFMMAAFGLTVEVMAHDQIGTLGDAGDATDYYLVTCSTDAGGVSGQLEVQVFDPTATQGGGKISAVVKHENIVSTASDPVRTDTAFGPPTFVHGGNGTYDVMVHKLKTSPKNYVLQYHCLTDAGIHTGTSLIILQDQ